MQQRQETPRKMWTVFCALGLMLFGASMAKADVSVSVVSGGVSPDPVDCGQPFNVTFSASLNGKPGTGVECEAKNVKWSWVVTVSGPMTSQTYTNPNGSSSYTLNHVANDEGIYTLSATATASYEASQECGGNSSASGSDSDSVQSINHSCE